MNPIEPIMLVGDDWMENKTNRDQFENSLIELDAKLSPISDAFKRSECLDESDFALMITL